MPEKSLTAIPNGNSCGFPKEVHVRLVTRQLGYHPRSARIRPLNPGPAQAQSSPKYVDVCNTESSQVLLPTHGLPINQRMPTQRLVLVIFLPNKTTDDLVDLA